MDNQKVTWDSLTAGERGALKAVSRGYILPRTMRKRLWDLGLAGSDDTTGEPYLTQSGESVLAQATPQPSDLGESLASLHETLPKLQQSAQKLLGLIEHAESKQPATITAQQFVDEGFAEKVKRGECTVHWGSDENPAYNRVVDVGRTYYDDSSYWIYPAKPNTVEIDVLAEPSYATVNDKLMVTWLTPQPVPAPAMVNISTSVIKDLEAIATGMTGDLTPANVANIALSKLTQEPATEQGGDFQTVRDAFDMSKSIMEPALALNRIEGELIQINELYTEAFEMNKAQRIERDAALAENATLRAQLQAATETSEAAEKANGVLREALSPYVDSYNDLLEQLAQPDVEPFVFSSQEDQFKAWIVNDFDLEGFLMIGADAKAALETVATPNADGGGSVMSNNTQHKLEALQMNTKLLIEETDPFLRRVLAETMISLALQVKRLIDNELLPASINDYEPTPSTDSEATSAASGEA